jgi:hypothetical protein|tara:strand:- start:137662 stop:137934 length:273 start_codon:yes stop_codon:yes gene_type:complete
MSNEVKDIALSILREHGSEQISTAEMRSLVAKRCIQRHPLLVWFFGESCVTPTEEEIHFAIVDLREEGHRINFRPCNSSQEADVNVPQFV